MSRMSTEAAAGESGSGTKRPLSEGSTPSTIVQVIKKKPREDVHSRREVQLQKKGVQTEWSSQTGSYVSLVKIAIVKRDFPSHKLSVKDSVSIKHAILLLTDAVLEVSEMEPFGTLIPEIHSCNLVKGALVIQCTNTTVEWIRCNFDFKVLGDMVLRVMRADELPKPVKVALETKENFSEQSTFLRHLQRLNPKLKSKGWRVLQFIDGPSSAKWIFEVDPEDLQAIREAGYKAFTGVDCGTFKIIHDPNRKVPIEVKTIDFVAPTETSDSSEPPIPLEFPAPEVHQEEEEVPVSSASLQASCM